MNRLLGVSVVTILLALLAGCAGTDTPRVSPNLDPPSCQFNEQYVCDVKSASRTRNDVDRTEFCRCERIDRIR